jgi:hypothetical protein
MLISVWDIYTEEMQAYEQQLRKIREQFIQQHRPIPLELDQLILEAENPITGGPDASMRAFMEMERKMKK